ncbi:MAG: phage major capsid protein [Clostridia bacterium]|nr:phage major capsid protein [Clostridia bacterium]
MLKIIKLRTQLQQKQKALKELRELKQSFKTREQELAVSLDEAKTDEDIEAINDQIAEIETELNGRDLEQEETTLEGEIVDIENQITEQRQKNDTALGGGSNPTPAPNTENRNNREVKSIMNTRTIWGRLSFERRSAIINSEESKTFLERVREFKGQQRAVNGGELFIPEVYLGLIRESITQYSKLAKYVNLKPVSGKARQGIAGVIPEAVWTEAVGKLNEMDISFGMLEVDGYKVGAFIPVPNSTLEDSDENLAATVLEAIAIAIGKALDKAILFGTGIKMPLGIFSRLAQTVQPDDWSNDAPAWTDLHESNILTLDLDEQTGEDFFIGLADAFGVPVNKYAVNSDVFWVMNRKTHIDIAKRALKFDSSASLVSKVGNTMPFIGGTIIEIEDMADGDIGGGFGGLYTLAERKGTTLGTSEHVRFIEDQTVFKGTARYDGKPVVSEGFVLFNYKNVAPTTTAEFAPDTANAA